MIAKKRNLGWLALRHVIAVFFFVLGLQASADESGDLENLSQLEWEHRILVLWSQSPQQDYEIIFASNKNEIDDRDMILFVLDESVLVTNYEDRLGSDLLEKIKARFPKTEGNYVLIGKDGGVKLRGEMLDINNVFGEIDLMPMRQLEIQNRR